MLKVAIVGRVNVGKSTLFNALLGSSVSIVWKEERTTRDVVEAVAHSKKRDYILMDTSGYLFSDHPLQRISEQKSDEAIKNADIVIAVFDGKAGLTAVDWEVRRKVLTSKKPCIFVVNKVDNKQIELSAYDTFSKFVGDFIMVSSSTKKGLEEVLSELDRIADELEEKRGLSTKKSDEQKPSEPEKRYEDDVKDVATTSSSLIERGFEEEMSPDDWMKGESLTKISRELKKKRMESINEEFRKIFAESPESSEESLRTGVGLGSQVVKYKKEHKGENKKVIRVAFVGRPNVGKSSLVNAVLGYPRCIVYEEPGTTRDAIRIPFEYGGYKFVIVDTPGVRKRSRIDENSVEFKSVGRALVAMQVSDVCILVIDSLEGITHQDKHLSSFVERNGRALVFALTKMDIIKELKPAGGIKKVVESLKSQMKFIDWAYFIPTSAVTKYGIDDLLEAVIKSYNGWSKRLKPSELLEIRKEFLKLDFMRFQEPKIFQLGVQPPTFLIYVNDPTVLRRYQVSHLESIIRTKHGFKGSPIHFRIKRHGEEF